MLRARVVRSADVTRLAVIQYFGELHGHGVPVDPDRDDASALECWEGGGVVSTVRRACNRTEIWDNSEFLELKRLQKNNSMEILKAIEILRGPTDLNQTLHSVSIAVPKSCANSLRRSTVVVEEVEP